MERRHEEQHAEQAVDDGRDALQRLGGGTHDSYETTAARRVFHQVDGRSHAHRHRHEQREGRHQQRVHQRRHERDVRGVVLPLEQAGREVRHAVHQDVAHQEQQHRRGQQRAQIHQRSQQHGKHAACGAMTLFRRFEHRIDPIARVGGGRRGGVDRFVGDRQLGTHYLVSPRFLITLNNIVMSRMNTNSTTPVATSAPRCRSAA